MNARKIRSLGDLARFVIDQIGHGAIGFVAAAPVLAWGRAGVAVSAAGVLAVREWEQWRAKSELGKESERALGPFARHLDRTLDVALGAVIAVFAVRITLGG